MIDNQHSLRIAICEDFPADALVLKEHISKSGLPTQCMHFSNGEDLLHCLTPGKYDLFFLDIYMNGITGIQAAEKIREIDETAILVFITSSLDHTLESYRLGALMYLEKPVKAAGVKEAIELALMKKKHRATITLWLAGGKNQAVPLDEIRYFEQKGHIIQVYTTSQGILHTTQSVKMNDIEKQLPSPQFLRCHRSYLVNLEYVQRVDKQLHAFRMNNGDQVDIRRGHLAQCTEAFLLWMADSHYFIEYQG